MKPRSDSRHEVGTRTIDSHQHFWQLSRFRYNWMDPSMTALRRDYMPVDLQPLLSAAGIHESVVVQADTSVEETRWLLTVAEEIPWIAGLVGWVDLMAPNAGDVLDELCQHPKLKGIRYLSDDKRHSQWPAHPDFLRGLGEVAKRGLAYDLGLQAQDLPYVQSVAERWPNLRMIIDHLAKPFIREGIREPWATHIANLARFPSVYCKVSGMITEADHVAWMPEDLTLYVRHVVDHFGVDRLMFGSDWPVCLLAGTYSQVVDALRICLLAVGLDAAALAKVFGSNADRFYRLD